MTDKTLIIDPSAYDLDRPIAAGDALLRYLPQRHEMLQLSAVVFDDVETGISVGFKNTGPDEFWVRGHMPDAPLMPGVIMCEAAAQLCTYHVMKNDLLKVEMMGFGGLDEVRFRDMVFPGDRLVIVTQRVALRARALVRFRFQCLVGSSIACEGEIRGVPIKPDSIRQGRNA